MLALSDEVARADGISGVVVIAIIYAILTVVGKIKEASQRNQPKPGPTGPPKQVAHQSRQNPPAKRSDPQSYTGRTATPMRRESSQYSAPSTQKEAHKLEDLFRALGEAAGVPLEGPMGRPSRVPLPSAEEVEETESLEVEERVQNLETYTRRAERELVDQDDQAEGIVRRRILAAEARDHSLTRVDHQEFDKRIRQVAADKTAVARLAGRRLKAGIVWREILGPPVALREDGEK